MIAKPFTGLTALAVVLMTALGFEYANHYHDEASSFPPLRAPTIQSVNVSLSPEDVPAHVDTILARPLFRVGRRPPSPDEVPAESLPRLSAVLVSENGKRLIFSGAAGGRQIVAAEGDHIGLYIVRSIVAGQAVVWGPEGSRIIRPSFKKQEVAAVPPQTASQIPKRQLPSVFPPAASELSHPPVNR
jgi:hypothetical protein